MKTRKRSWVCMLVCFVIFFAGVGRVQAAEQKTDTEAASSGAELYGTPAKGKELRKLNGEYYLFKNGRQLKSTCWYQATNNVAYYVKKGKVQYKRKKIGNLYVMYSRTSNKWTSVSNKWAPVNKGVSVYFNSKGVSTRMFFGDDYKIDSYKLTYWTYSTKTSSWKQKKNQFVKVDSVHYYIQESGAALASVGWHVIGSTNTSLIYTDADGKIYGYIYYDEAKKCSVYKKGLKLKKTEPGLFSANVDGVSTYYLFDNQGKSCSGAQTVEDYIYEFDEYGRAFSRCLSGGLYANTDVWMRRIMHTYLGKTGIYCNPFVNQAFALAGGSNPEKAKSAVRYSNKTSGGILIDTYATCTAWGGAGIVVGTATLSDGTSWLKSDEIIMNNDIRDFSYDELSPGDVIVYYKKGQTSASHVSLFLGKFENVQALKQYLQKLGVSESKCNAYVKEWGTYYGNDGQYWCIEGGMGSNRQVYICNSTYCVPTSTGNEYAKKIVKVFQ